jgi:DNA-binding IclR family transcriptional regulator
MSASPPAAPADTGTVHRVLRLLSAFAERERWSNAELSRHLGLPRGTTNRLLLLCKPAQFVEQDADGLYGPGPELYRLAGQLVSRMPLQRMAQPVLDGLRDAIDETALLTLLVRNELKMFFALTAAPSHPMRYAIETNKLQPLAWGATGRALLAWLTEEEIAEVIRRREPSPLDGRALDAAELRASLQAIREQGTAVTHSQRTPQAYGLAAPFFDREGQVRGNLAFTIPDFRFRRKDAPRLTKLLEEAARDLERRLGWR